MTREAKKVAGNKPLPGLGGVTRDQLIEFLKRQEEESALKPEVIKELYEPEDKTLITENPERMILPKIRMRMLLAATDPTRKEPLIKVFLDAYNEEMISLRRQGRLELLGALQALSDGMDGEKSTTLGR